MWPKSDSQDASEKESTDLRGFLLGIWIDLSPYLRAILVGVGKTAALLLSLAFVRWLMDVLGLTIGWEGYIISSVHSIEVTVSLLVFGIFFLLDVIAIRKNRH